MGLNGASWVLNIGVRRSHFDTTRYNIIRKNSYETSHIQVNPKVGLECACNSEETA